MPRLPYMTRLDVFFLISTLLVFFSLIEVWSQPFSITMSSPRERRRLIATASNRPRNSLLPRLPSLPIRAADNREPV